MECFGKKQLHEMIKKITQNEGEGAILRKHGSLYEHGRSESLLKFKVF